MWTVKEYKMFLARNFDEVSFVIFQLLIEKRNTYPGILNLVLQEAKTVLETRRFNYHDPLDGEAWDVLRPIRIAVDFEFQRLHLLALVYQQLVDYHADEQSLNEEAELKRILHVGDL